MFRWKLVVPLTPILIVLLTLFWLWSPPTLLQDNPTGSVPDVPYVHPSLSSVVSDTTPSKDITSPPPAPFYPTPAPRITITAIWNPNGQPVIYLNNFFASVAANPSIDLLLIVYDKFDLGCNHPVAPPNIPNVREICLSFEEYWELHADYLCKYWQCSASDKEDVFDMLMERAPDERVNSSFRPLRAGIFSRWINPETPIWGWCDMDTMLGNFERAFPWDLAQDFDILVPALPTHGDNILLFLAGHLAFFRNAKRVTDEFMNFPNLKSITAYLAMPWISDGAEEIEYSHFAFLNPRLTFLRFHAIVYTRYHVSSPGGGTYAIENEQLWDVSSSPGSSSDDASRAAFIDTLKRREKEWKPIPTFSPDGYEYTVELREGMFPHELWFPLQYAVDFVPSPDFSRVPDAQSKRYAMRRAPNGPVTERIEPDEAAVVILYPADYEATKGKDSATTIETDSSPDSELKSSNPYNRYNRPILIEFLYNHFQGEKYAPWWNLPKQPLDHDDVLFIDRQNGAQIWSPNGRIKFDTTVANAAIEDRRAVDASTSTDTRQ